LERELAESGLGKFQPGLRLHYNYIIKTLYQKGT
jgi:hypothetical protein